MKNKTKLGALFVFVGVFCLTLSASAHNGRPGHPIQKPNAQPVQNKVVTPVVPPPPAPIIPKEGQAVIKLEKNGKIVVRGTLLSISGSTVTVSSQGTLFTVDVSTSLICNKNVSSISAFELGDFVGVKGTVSKTNPNAITATLIRDRSMTQ